MESLIKKVSMKMQVYQFLRERILNQDFKAGEHINLDELCRTLGVSNTPVREAVSMLERDNLVVNTSNVGVSVIAPTKKQFFDISQVLLFMVLGAYEYCRSQEETMAVVLAGMEKTLMKQKGFLEKNDAVRYVECSYEFERNFILGTDNPMLLKSYDDMATMVAFVSSYYANRDLEILRGFFNQHEEIFQYIRQGSTDKALEILKVHFYKPCLVPDELSGRI
ncbi:GntR family transcriptional regulator [Lachnospiraceae bacterium 54-53]